MRTYEKTHSWLKFSLDLRKASPQLWMSLGEAQSKCDHISRVPLRPKTADELHKIYLSKGVAATTAIEGNTLSEEDVLKHIKGELSVPVSKEYLVQEIDNIIDLCSEIFEDIMKGDKNSNALSVEKIKAYDKGVLKNLKLEEGVVPGEIRKHSVGVGSYRGAPAEDCEFLLSKLCEWLNSSDFEPPDDRQAVIYGILKAIIAHIYIAWIHPFGDGNGRTSRLVEFQVLLCAGVPTPAAHLLSNHYNQTRQEYYRQLDRASKSGGDIVPFIEYAVQGFVDGLRAQLEFIHNQQFDVIWRNYIHEQFKERNTNAHHRQRHLMLDLSEKKGIVPISKITEISPRVAKHYANLSPKTLSRDLAELVEMGILEKTNDGGLRARTELISRFLPPKKKHRVSE